MAAPVYVIGSPVRRHGRRAVVVETVARPTAKKHGEDRDARERDHDRPAERLARWWSERR